MKKSCTHDPTKSPLNRTVGYFELLLVCNLKNHFNFQLWKLKSVKFNSQKEAKFQSTSRINCSSLNFRSHAKLPTRFFSKVSFKNSYTSFLIILFHALSNLHLTLITIFSEFSIRFTSFASLLKNIQFITKGELSITVIAAVF